MFVHCCGRRLTVFMIERMRQPKWWFLLSVTTVVCIVVTMCDIEVVPLLRLPAVASSPAVRIGTVVKDPVFCSGVDRRFQCTKNDFRLPISHDDLLEDGCDMLVQGGVKHILFVGDSYMRHVYVAFMLSLKHNYQDGALNTPHDMKCDFEGQFEEKVCRLQLMFRSALCNGLVHIALKYGAFVFPTLSDLEGNDLVIWSFGNHPIAVKDYTFFNISQEEELTARSNGSQQNNSTFYRETVLPVICPTAPSDLRALMALKVVYVNTHPQGWNYLPNVTRHSFFQTTPYLLHYHQDLPPLLQAMCGVLHQVSVWKEVELLVATPGVQWESLTYDFVHWKLMVNLMKVQKLLLEIRGMLPLSNAAAATAQSSKTVALPPASRNTTSPKPSTPPTPSLPSVVPLGFMVSNQLVDRAFAQLAQVNADFRADFSLHGVNSTRRACVYYCEQSCGGQGDRLKGVMAVATLALLLGQAVFLKFPDSAMIDELLLPKSIDWRLPEGLVPTASNAVRRLPQSIPGTLKMMMTFVEEKHLAAATFFWINQHALPSLLATPRFVERALSIGFSASKDPVEERFAAEHAVLSRLFKLSPLLQKALDRAQKQMRYQEVGPPVVALHFRLGGAKLNDPVRFDATNSSLLSVARCALKMEALMVDSHSHTNTSASEAEAPAAGRWLCLSDTDRLCANFSALVASEWKMLPPSKVVSPVHSVGILQSDRFSRGTSKAVVRAGMVDVWVDFLLISQVKFMVATSGQYMVTAAMFGNARLLTKAPRCALRRLF